MSTCSSVFRISGAVVSRSNEDGPFDTPVDDFCVLAADAPTALATAATYLANLFPEQTAINITDGATAVIQMVIVTP